LIILLVGNLVEGAFLRCGLGRGIFCNIFFVFVIFFVVTSDWCIFL
jgi:hypothetical protein